MFEQDKEHPLKGAKVYAKLPNLENAIIETDDKGIAKVEYSVEGDIEVEKIEIFSDENDLFQVVKVTG